MNARAPVIGLDVGGTHIKAVVVDASGRTLVEESALTEDCGDARWKESARTLCARLRERVPGIAAIGLCAPGLAARDERSICHMPGRMHGIEGFHWEKHLGLPTLVLNDAHAALLGECWLGAARGCENVVMLTLGTGVGGAALADGRLLRGCLGRAGHFGHMSLDPAGTPSSMRTPGSLENEIGDLTVAARSAGRFTSTRDLVTAVRTGDPAARAIWLRSIRALAAALVSLINALDPEKIILGGGIAQAGELLFDPLQDRLAQIEWRPAGHTVPVIPAQLGSPAGALGAAHRALQSLSLP